MMPFEHRYNALEGNSKMANQVEYFTKLFNGSGFGTGFYFSYHADLTLSHEEWHDQSLQDRPYSCNLMRRPEYVWNLDLLKDFLMQAVSHRWLVPLI